MYGGSITQNIDTKLKTYIIIGHGDSGRNVVSLPENCVLVTTTLCGNISFRVPKEKLEVLFENQDNRLREPWKKDNFKYLNKNLTHPDSYPFLSNFTTNKYPENRDDNSHKYLTMHISKDSFKTSEPYDDLFRYLDNKIYFQMSWFYKDGKLLSSIQEGENYNVLITKSGLFDMDIKLRPGFFDEEEIIRKTDGYTVPMITFRNIEFMYEYSIFPTIDDIKQYTRLYLQKHNQSKYCEPGIFLNPSYICAHEFIDMINRNFSVYQSYLFENFPGIYYFNKCRPFPDVDEATKILQRQRSIESKKRLTRIIHDPFESTSQHVTPRINVGDKVKYYDIRANRDFVYNVINEDGNEYLLESIEPGIGQISVKEEELHKYPWILLRFNIGDRVKLYDPMYNSENIFDIIRREGDEYILKNIDDGVNPVMKQLSVKVDELNYYPWEKVEIPITQPEMTIHDEHKNNEQYFSVGDPVEIKQTKQTFNVKEVVTTKDGFYGYILEDGTGKIYYDTELDYSL
jgi:hypothetical protein